jgi:hypothetical protein
MTEPLDQFTKEQLKAALLFKSNECEQLKLQVVELQSQVSTLSAPKPPPAAAVAASAVAATNKNASDLINQASNNLVAGGSVKAEDPINIRNLEERWKARFQQLVRYKLRHGHCNVTKKQDAQLHAWIRKQRVNKQQYDQTGKGMKLAHVQALDELQFDWHVGHQSRDDLWETNYKALLKSAQEIGTVERSADKKLNKWIENQRSRRKLLEQKGPGKAKGMTWERVQKLDAIGFRW